MSNDFFVRFGSDAAKFGRQLDTDLAGARRTIGAFAKQLADLETSAANRRTATMRHLAAMSSEADRVQKKLDGIEAAHQAAGINPDVANVQQIAAEANQSIATVVSNLDGVISRLETFVRAMDATTPAAKKQRQTENRADGQRTRTDQVRDPATGRTVTPGTEGAVPFRLQDLERLLGKFIEADRVGRPLQVESIPQATIDEAAFQRVVAAIEQNVVATRAVEEAVNRLGRQESTPPAGESAPAQAQAQAQQQVYADGGVNGAKGQALDKVVEQMAARSDGPTKRQVQLDKSIETLTSRERELRTEIERLAHDMQEGAQVSAVFGRNLAELADVEKRLASARQARATDESRAEQQERQRRAASRAAAAQQGIKVSPEEQRHRQDERARLELAANPERLQSMVGRAQGKLGKSDLQQIAETLTRQGYDVDQGSRRPDGTTRLTIPQLLERITAAGREYLSTGRATAEDLSARRVERPQTQLSTDVQNLIGEELPRVAQQFTQELGRLGISVEQAYQLIGANLRSGGEDPRREKVRGRLEVGAEIGNELRDMLPAAVDRIETYNRDRSSAARRTVVGALRSDSQFNPYEMDRTIPGRDQTAQQARRDVAALLKATEEVDQFATDLGSLDEALVKAQRKQEALLRKLQAFDNIRNPTKDQTSDYLKNLDQHQKQRDVVAEARDALATKMEEFKSAGLGDASFMLDPNFQRGVAQRSQSRMYSEAYAENDRYQAQQRFTGRQALRDATFDYFGGARTFATTQGNTRDYFARNLPGVRTTGSIGRQRLGFTDDSMMSSPENRRAIRQMTAGLVGYTARLNDLIDETADGNRTEEQLNETRVKVIQALNRLLGGYASAFPTQQVPDIQNFLPPSMFGKEGTQLVDVAQFDKEGAARAQARQDRSAGNRESIEQLEAKAAKAYKDPARSEQMRNELLKAIRGQIRAINKEISGLGAEDVERRQVLQAQRQTLRDQRKRVSGRVDPEDLELQFGSIAAAEKRLGQVTGRLERATSSLARAREELTQREEFTRGSLSPESQKAYDVARGQRTDLQGRIKEIQTGDAIRADREEGALDPNNVAQAEAARAELGRLTSQLGAVNSTLAQYERLAHSVNPTTAFSTVNRPGDYANIETEGLAAGIRNLEEDESRISRTIGEINRDLDTLRNALAISSAAFREQQSRRGDKAMREPNIPGFGENGAGGNGTTPPPAGAGAAEPGGPGRSGILLEILAALNRIDGRLKGTLKVSGSLKTKAVDEAEAAAKRPTTERMPRSSAAGRADFEQSISQTIPAVGQFLTEGKDVEAAAALITQGVMSETRVLDLFRDKLKQSTDQAKTFQREVRAAVGDTRNQAAADAAAQQRAKEEAKRFQTRSGESMTVKEARAEMRESMAASKRQQEEQRRATSDERQAAAAAVVHAQAMSRLTEQTRAEIAELERMARSTDRSEQAQRRLAEQMAKVYGLAARDLKTRATETNQAVGHIYKGAGLSTTGEEVAGMRNAARSLGHDVDQAAAQGVIPGGIFGEQSAFTKAMFGNHGFWSRVMASTGTFVVRNFTAGFVFGITNALQEVIKEAIQTESTFIKVSSALEATGRSAGGLRTQLQGISTDYGVALNDVYETAAGLTGLFDNVDDIAGATRIVAQLTMISRGALNAQEAMGTLASITSAYSNLSGSEGLQKVADVLTVIQERVGVNIETTAEGVARLSGLSQQVGLSFEQTAVFVGEIAKRTNQTGAAAGEQFSRIIASMQSGRGRELLTKNLPGTNIQDALNAREYGAAIEILMQNYGGLTKAQQDNITVGLGGQRQAAAINALLHNGAESLATVRAATLAKGQADERAKQISHTLNNQLEVFNQNIVNLAQNLVRSGIVSAFAGILISVNAVLGGVNHLFSTINDFTDNNDLLRWAKNIGLGLLGLVVTLNLVRRAMSGLRATIKEMPALNAGMEAAASPAGVGGAPRTLRQRLGSRTAGIGTAYAPGMGLFGRVDRTPDGSVPVNRFGRALESVSSGPLKAADRGLTRLSENITRSADALRARGIADIEAGGTGSRALSASNRYDAYARGASRASGFFGGVGQFTQEFLRGQGPVRNALSSGSVAMSERAGLLSQRADRMQPWANTAASRAQVAATRIMANTSSGAAKAMSGLSSGLSKVSMGGMGAQAALSGLGIAMSLVVAEMLRAEQFARDYHNAYQASFGSQEAGNTAGVNQGPQYAGPNDELIQQRRKELIDGGGGWNRGFSARLGDIGAAFRHPLTDFDTLSSQRAGDLPDDVSNEQLKVMVGAFAKMKTVAGGAAKTVDEVSAAQKEALASVDADMAKINANGDLSDEQKAAAAAFYENVKLNITKVGTNARLSVNSLSGVTALTLEQLDPLSNMIQMLASSGPAAPGAFDEITQQMVTDLGLPDDSQIQRIVDGLNKRGLSIADAAHLQVEASDEIAKSLSAMLESMTAPGSTYSQDDIDAVTQRLQQILGQRQSQVDAEIQARVTESQTYNEFLSNRGAAGGPMAQQALERAVTSLQTELHRPGQDPARKVAILNQIQQLESQFSQSIMSQMQQRSQLAQSRTMIASRNAQLELEEAQRELKYMRQRFAAGDATVGEVRAAEISRNQALQNRLQIKLQDAAAARDTAAARVPQGDAVAVAAAALNNANAAVEDAKVFGVTSAQYQQALQTQIGAQESFNQAQASVGQAQADLTAAYASARGDAVAAAQAAANGARLALAEAIRQAGGNMNAPAVLQAQANLVNLNAQVDQSQTALLQSKYDVSIALANASGNTVKAARLTLQKAHQALQRALKTSGGENTADVNAARASEIQSRAALRDAHLQDQLDTIDFNLQMGKMTQSSAISALQQILKTKDLTKQQRRQLMLQIKGYKDAISQDGQWNFGDIKLPTPYQMRRYVEEHRRSVQKLGEAQAAQYGSLVTDASVGGGRGGRPITNNHHTTHNQTTIQINGADVAKVRRVVEDVLGKSHRTRTNQPRRR